MNLGRVPECRLTCAFAQFFRNAHEAMYISSREGTLMEVNTAFASMLGYTVGELVGQPVSLILENADDREEYRRMIESDGVVHDYPITMQRKDGTMLLGMIDAIVWRDEGRPSGYHGIIRTRSSVLESIRSFMNKLKEARQQIREERRNLISDTMLLSRYLTDDLITHVQKTGRNPLETGRTRVTVLFFDIRNSTGIAERLRPEQFASFLSDILTDIMDLVYGCKGSVNKLLGDGLMATFGVPISDSFGSDAQNAVEAAMRIRDYLTTFNDVRPEFLADPVDAGIGIATGSMFAGVIGSVRRQEYAVLGDPVNIASRLEQLTKSAKKPILMDEETWHEVKNYCDCSPVGQVRIRGRAEALRVYAPAGK